jgi:hypothetical protein
MPDAAAEATVVHGLAEVDAAEWDALANPDPATFNPFLAHAFLKALEDAKTVGGRTGWLPHHILVRDGGGHLEGCAPAYVKLHSQGEYVFDHGWADAFERAGGRYYPKLQLAVPFTPVPGPRLLIAPGADRAATTARLGAAAIALAEKLGASSVHATFLPEQQASDLAPLGYLARTGQQFHWQNRGYRSFDDFLATLASRKRKAIRKERATALAAGLDVRLLSGVEISEAHWDAFFAFYMDTGARKWGQPYLNRAFFSLLGERMGRHCLLALAFRSGRPIAGALNLIGGNCLYGRYWGAIEQHPCLHFELCYYQAIDYAIANRLERVEAGAQGEHKLARGYLPEPTYSAHWIAHPGLRRAIARFLVEERAALEEQREILADYGPYRRTPEEQD